jgi:uracil-DNA glycosylase
VERLAGTRIGRTFNQYVEGPRASLLRRRLVDYLEERSHARLLLVGEAPGYRGARISGIPFTSERQLTGVGPAEATASILRRTLVELDLEQQVLLWNVVPMHPGTATSNRRPTRDEIIAGAVFAFELAADRELIAVGRVAHRALGGHYVRHPSHGGSRAFRAGLVEFAGP